MSSEIDCIHRFDFHYFSSAFKEIAKRKDLVGTGKVIEMEFNPFKVTNPYAYPNLYGVTWKFYYNFDDDLSRFTLEWTTQDGAKRRQVIWLYFAPSNLGNGYVGYFICPITHKYCRKLYTDGKAIASRYAFTHHYSYQHQSRKERMYSKLHRYGEDKQEALLKHRQTYRGKPTRWAKRLDEVEAEWQEAWNKVSKGLESLIAKHRENIS